MSNEIQLMELADNLQIEKADSSILQALTYTTKQGKEQITYTGLKWLALEMSTQGNPLEIVTQQTILTKYDETDQAKWHWQSTIVMRNKNTGYETVGVSESPFLDFSRGGIYDNFGKTKASSKAERNCIRKHVPELMIVELMQKAKAEGRVEEISDKQNMQQIPTDDKPSEKQITYLLDLNPNARIPKTKAECSKMIEELKK